MLTFAQVREALRWRWRLAAQKRFLRNTFENGDALVESYLNRTPCDQAISKDGTVVRHPEGRVGLAGMILELWHDRVYTADFYQPRAGDFVIDAGANIGLFSLLVAKTEPKCEIHAFEPFDSNHKLLQENLRSARVTNVHDHQIAITGESSVGIMVDGGARSQDHKLVLGEGGGGTPVRTFGFDDLRTLAGSRPIALFKCDIEGSEFELFQRMRPLDFGMVEKFALEYHDNVRPGVLALLKDRLEATHTVVVRPQGPGYGMLYAAAKRRH